MTVEDENPCARGCSGRGSRAGDISPTRMLRARRATVTASAWTRMAQVKPAVAVIDTLLRGVGQVMFQNNPITGLLFLAGIGINSYKYSLTALLGLVVATLAAYLLGADRTLIRNGLFGFNGVLTGIALSVFLQWDWHVAVYIILGAIVSTIVMMGLAKLLISWDMTPLTAPFVLTAWLLLFALYQFGQLHPTKLIGPMPVHPGAAIQTDLQEAAGGGGAVGLTVANLANALFRGVGQVFLQDNLWTGVVFAIAILVNSRACCGFALLGSALGGLERQGLGDEEARARLAQYGPNEMDAHKPVPAWRRFLSQFQDVLVILLLIATLISAGLWLYERESALPYEAIAILAVVLLNAVMGYVQESRAEQAVAALRAMSAQEATVMREGERRRVPAAEL